MVTWQFCPALSFILFQRTLCYSPGSALGSLSCSSPGTTHSTLLGCYELTHLYELTVPVVPVHFG